IKILFLLSLAFGKLNKTDKIIIGKGLKVEIFGVIFSKNTTCLLLIFKRAREQNPLCCGGRGRVFLFLFSRKKKKGLKEFMVLVGTADSLAEHTLYEYKVKSAILYDRTSTRLNYRIVSSAYDIICLISK